MGECMVYAQHYFCTHVRFSVRQKRATATADKATMWPPAVVEKDGERCKRWRSHPKNFVSIDIGSPFFYFPFRLERAAFQNDGCIHIFHISK